jgi:hypothetical protein
VLQSHSTLLFLLAFLGGGNVYEGRVVRVIDGYSVSVSARSVGVGDYGQALRIDAEIRDTEKENFSSNGEWRS